MIIGCGKCGKPIQNTYDGELGWDKMIYPSCYGILKCLQSMKYKVFHNLLMWWIKGCG